MAVITAQVISLVGLFQTFQNIFFGIIMAFAGKHSLAGYSTAVNTDFSRVNFLVVQNCQDETIISVNFHYCYILIVHIISVLFILLIYQLYFNRKNLFG
nr:MAG TPA: hypothetical protein [Caudoviricetes sp.]